MQYKWKMIFNLFGTHGYLTMRYLILENNPPAAQGLAPGIEVSYETAEQNPSFFFWLPTRIFIDHLKMSTVTL